MSKYNVLWLDDQYDSDELQEIADKAYDDFAIKLEGFKSGEEGIEELEKFERKEIHYHAILLDARFYLNRDATAGSEDIKGLKAVTKKLDQLEGKGIQIPRFILSGKTTLSKDDTFIDTYGEFYSKHIPSDIKRLFEDICKQADNRDETLIRTKYKDVLASCSASFIGIKNEANLVKILVGYEKGDFTNPDYFNQIRKVMEDIFEYCKKKNVFPLHITKMNERSRHIHSDNKYPIHIRRSVQSVVDICQEGSHKTDVDSMVSKGQAPYLVSSTIMNLMNILIWIKTI